MPTVAAICDDCGAMFPTGIYLGVGTSTYLSGGVAGTCPNCGGMGSIPDGLYDFVGDTLRIISGWTPERRQHLAAELAAAKESADPRAAAEAAISDEPDLLEVAKRLLIPRDAGQFWAFIAALLALIALLGAQTGEDVTVNNITVIEQVMSNPTATIPEGRSRPGPPP